MFIGRSNQPLAYLECKSIGLSVRSEGFVRIDQQVVDGRLCH